VYLQKVISKKNCKKLFFLASCQLLTEKQDPDTNLPIREFDFDDFCNGRLSAFSDIDAKCAQNSP
jgi:hypothetical protein